VLAVERSRRVTALVVSGAFFFLCLAVCPLHAAKEDRAGELGLQLGVFVPDSDLSGRPGKIDNSKAEIGFRGDYFFHRGYGWFVDALYQDYDSDAPGGDVRSYAARTGIEFLARPHWSWQQTFLSVGLGWLVVDQRNLASFDRPFGSLGVGQRFAVGEKTWLRWELRGDATLSDDGLDGRNLFTGHLLLGLTWGGQRRRPDADGDGVPDRSDQCPGTPAGAIVDGRGCPIDSDGDGVPDGIDRCPDTPAGAIVDERGCPIDSDGDGVPDGIDRCPDTPAGAIVDDRGCPIDSDGDGVPDGIDRCPDTPAGAIVDDRGCPIDSDGDGVPDGIDRCPDTPTGVPVDEQGCPKAAPLFPEERRMLVLEGVNFGFDSDRLAPESRTVLDEVAASLLSWPKIRLEIGGHTDSAGAAEYNQRLSEKRARAVHDYLVGKGVSPGRLRARGYGETRPIADNRSAGGRKQNRRVELTAID
jgi:OOP family OmpA-OmpF porin